VKHRLECGLCSTEHDPEVLQTVCRECARPLLCRFDFAGAGTQAIDQRRNDLWRYAAFLPECEPLSLGEGWTPLHHAKKLGNGIWIKDEGVNPTASFKARGMSVAVAMANRLGATELAVPSAGNAGGALAAYAAAAGMSAHVFMPVDTPAACIFECEMHGADVHLVDGLITDCAAEIRRRVESGAPWFDMSTLKEPFRLEGKKTMGYELYEQMDGRLPEAIVYPTGGGTGLIGMGKAFDEMEAMGWIGASRPKMISVQADGCRPIASAFESGERFAAEHAGAQTAASGLRVPKAVGDFLMLDLIRSTGGTALSVSDEEMMVAAREIAELTGVFACPEGGATWSAARRLYDSGFLSAGETVVLFNTGSGIKYQEALSRSQGAG
jgi:threonine synthase